MEIPFFIYRHTSMTEDKDNLLKDFKCQRCGACCRWPGDVRVTEEEQNAIAARLNMNINDFLQQYTRLTADRRGLSLIDNEHGHCIFYSTEEGCRINSVKPQQCVNFPYHWTNPGWEKLCAGAQNLSRIKLVRVRTVE